MTHPIKQPAPHQTSQSGHVLVLLSEANAIPLREGGAHPTGHFLGELTEPLESILNAGHRVTFTSPYGKSPTIDKNSFQLMYWRFSKQQLTKAKACYQHLVELGLQTPQPLSELLARPSKLEQFDALFVPGGHAPMVDLLHEDFFSSDGRNERVGELLYFFHRTNRPTGLICHAPAVLATAPHIDGRWIYSGYRMTAITMVLEFFAEDLFLVKAVDGHIKEYPTKILKQAGAILEQNPIPMIPKVVEDRELITGQDPYSAKAFGKKFVEKIDQHLKTKHES